MHTQKETTVLIGTLKGTQWYNFAVLLSSVGWMLYRQKHTSHMPTEWRLFLILTHTLAASGHSLLSWRKFSPKKNNNTLHQIKLSFLTSMYVIISIVFFSSLKSEPGKYRPLSPCCVTRNQVFVFLCSQSLPFVLFCFFFFIWGCPQHRKSIPETDLWLLKPSAGQIIALLLTGGGRPGVLEKWRIYLRQSDLESFWNVSKYFALLLIYSRLRTAHGL